MLLVSIVDARPAILECDFNLHKSNSTYFTDLDVSRAHLSGILFEPLLFGSTPLGRCNLIVGAVSCVFRKEIKPYQPYELWTKIVSWDGKWIYMVTHFVPRGTSRRPSYTEGSQRAENLPDPQRALEEEWKDVVLASAITRMVFKRDRVTVPPAGAFKACGLYPEGIQESATPIATEDDPSKASQESDSHIAPEDDPSKASCLCAFYRVTQTSTSTYKNLKYDGMESRRVAGLPIAQLRNGWDAVHSLFQAEPYALAKHKDFL